MYTINPTRYIKNEKNTKKIEIKPSKASVKQLLGQKVAFLYCRRILNVLLVLLQQLLVVRSSMLGYKLGCLTRLGRQLLQLCRHQICKKKKKLPINNYFKPFTSIKSFKLLY